MNNYNLIDTTNLLTPRQTNVGSINGIVVFILIAIFIAIAIGWTIANQEPQKNYSFPKRNQ